MLRWVLAVVAAAMAVSVMAQQRMLGATAIDKAAVFSGQIGRLVTYVCPAQIPLTAALWGTDSYSDDSPICLAAIHAGVLTAGKPGVVKILIGGGVSAFQGSTRNGVTSQSYRGLPSSITFVSGGPPGQVDWTTTAQGLPSDLAASVVVSCPSAGSLAGKVWGTDIYTEDSSICVAAVHGGIITAAGGGLVAVAAAPGQSTYAGSDRNSVVSASYSALGKSFRVAAAPAYIGPAPLMQTATTTLPAAAPTPDNNTEAPTAQPPPAFIGPAPARQSSTAVLPSAPAASAEGASAGGACGGTEFANFCAVALNPASIKLTWSAHPAATSYRISRDGQVIATVASAGEFIDESLTPGATASYTIDALRSAGTVSLGGEAQTRARMNDTTEQAEPANTNAPRLDRSEVLATAPAKSATTPILGTPTNVTAAVINGAKGQVRVAWAAVAGANGYLVYRDGNPRPTNSSAATNLSFDDTGVPLGRHRYQVEALFTTASRRTVNGEASSEAVAEVAFPTPGARFLSLPGGPDNPEQLDAHFRTRCGPEGVSLDINECAPVFPILNAHSNFEENWAADLSFGSAAPTRPNWIIATFADVTALGLGRRVNCAPRREPAGPVLCWATSHGTIPTPGAAIDGAALARAGENVENVKSLNVILAYPNGRTFFGTWERSGPNSGVSPFDNEFNFAKAGKVRFGTALDSQGIKPVPHACLSCHGGYYDPQSKMILGASLLPLIPSQLRFSSPQSRASQEENIRQFNQIVLSSNPAPAIVAQINALYDGTPATPGTRANDAAVPAGWRTDPNIYRQVIEPYCASCHFSRRGPLSLASVADARTARGAILNTTCNTFTMPHSEMQFRRFWTEGGNVSLPGLLATWLGAQRCGP